MSISRVWAIGFCIAAIAAAACGWAVGYKVFGGERASIERGIEGQRGFLQAVRTQRLGAEDLEARVAELGNLTLGGDQETVDNAFRNRITSLMDECGLGPRTFSINRIMAYETPAKKEFKRTNTQRKYRDEKDFVQISGSLRGVGTFKQVIRFIHRLDAEPWLKRLEVIRIQPEGGGRRVSLSMRLSTVFMPAVEPAGTFIEPNPSWPFERYSNLVASNPFLTPKKAEKPARPVVAPPPVDPRSQWKLTSIIDGPDGVEAWFSNIATQETAILEPGESLAGCVFNGADLDIARFAANTETFRILIGFTLDKPLR